MKKKKSLQNHSVDDNRMDQWLKNYFLDPLTTHYDHSQFKIDIYETDKEWIIEALLKDYVSSEITVKTENTKLIITAQKDAFSSTTPFPSRVRTINFPFPIVNHHIHATFLNGILEIFITKTETGLGNNRYITLP